MKKLFNRIRMFLFWLIAWEMVHLPNQEPFYELTFYTVTGKWPWKQVFYHTVAEFKYAKKFTEDRRFLDVLHDRNASRRIADMANKSRLDRVVVADGDTIEFVDGKGWTKNKLK